MAQLNSEKTGFVKFTIYILALILALLLASLCEAETPVSSGISIDTTLTQVAGTSIVTSLATIRTDKVRNVADILMNSQTR